MKILKAFAGAAAAVFLTLMLTGIKAEAAPHLTKDGEFFDYIYYADTYPDLKAAFGYNYTKLYEHYTVIGKSEGRLGFNPAELPSDVPYPVEVAGRTVLSTTRELDISGTDLKNFDLGAVIDAMPYLQKVTMINCGLDNAGYAALQDAYPYVRMIWEIKLTKRTLRTDAVGFSTLIANESDGRLNDAECYYLKYCTDLVALDLGHNYLHDISFLEYMPNLKIFIIVDSGGLRDLSPLKNCPKLEYLEFFVNRVSDLSFLQYTPHIRELNISYNPIYSNEYLKNLPELEKLWCEATGIPAAQINELRAIYPNATIVNVGSGSVDQGWRQGRRWQAMRSILKENRVNDIFY